jgi:uncharacterized protein YjbK
MAGSHHEIELKLALPGRAQYEALLERLGTPQDVLRQRNLFFDGPAGELTAMRLALRVREEVASGGTPRRELTLKGGGRTQGDVHAREERAAPLELSLEEVQRDASRLLRLELPPVQALRERLPHLKRLVCLGGFNNLRRTYPREVRLGQGGGDRTVDVLWEVDCTRYVSGEDHEIEIELSDVELAGRVATRVRQQLVDWGLMPTDQPQSKYARFRKRRR